MRLIIDLGDELNGGKIAIKHLKELLNETYKNKGNNTDIIDNKYKWVTKVTSFKRMSPLKRCKISTGEGER